jgi:hypothetical protein
VAISAATSNYSHGCHRQLDGSQEPGREAQAETGGPEQQQTRVVVIALGGGSELLPSLELLDRCDDPPLAGLSCSGKFPTVVGGVPLVPGTLRVRASGIDRQGSVMTTTAAPETTRVKRPAWLLILTLPAFVVFLGVATVTVAAQT